MPSVSIPAAVVGGGLISSVVGGNAAQQAANTQANAANHAADLQMQMFNQVQQNLQPWLQTGQQALAAEAGGLGLSPQTQGGPAQGSLIAPFQPTMDQLEKTPGYQFTKQQGLEAAQNGFAAQGLGSSGAAIKGATNYAEGLASTTYQQQFQNYLTQNQQIYNMLGGVSGSGQNAGANLGSLGLQTAGNVGNALQSGAAAQAAGTIGAANATIGGVNSLTQGASLAALMNNSGGLFGSDAGASSRANYGSLGQFFGVS